LVFDASGKLLKDARKVKSGDEISAQLAKGTVRARVEAKN
jgi:exonuclease VII large subunit